MYRFLLTPRWWGINLFAVLAVPLCVFMGSWQLGRFEDRVDSHRSVQERAAEAQSGATADGAAPLAELLPVDSETAGQAATATGRYDTGRQFLVPDRMLDGRRGFYVLSLLLTDGGVEGGGADRSGAGSDGAAGGADGDGKALPVVRGWLPGDPDPDRVPAPPAGQVTVTGALQASEHRDSPGVQAGSPLSDGRLGMISAAALVNLVPHDVYDAWVTVLEPAAPLKAVPPAAPQGTGLDVKAFQNLGYTGEWFVFAGFVLFMWYRLFRREVEAARDQALGLDPGPDPDSGGPGPASGAGPDGGRDGGRDNDPDTAPDTAPEPAVTATDAAGRTRSPAASA